MKSRFDRFEETDSACDDAVIEYKQAATATKDEHDRLWNCS